MAGGQAKESGQRMTKVPATGAVARLQGGLRSGPPGSPKTKGPLSGLLFEVKAWFMRSVELNEVCC